MDAGFARLARRGPVTSDEQLNDAGRAFREEIEVRTDGLKRPSTRHRRWRWAPSAHPVLCSFVATPASHRPWPCALLELAASTSQTCCAVRTAYYNHEIRSPAG